MRNKYLLSSLIFFTLFITSLFISHEAAALAPGTLLYRTTTDGKMFGYSDDPLIEVQNGVLQGINPGHVAIYIGQENGQHYVVEALATGVVKTLAEHFVNEAAGEKLIGAKLPAGLSTLERLKAVKIAKSLAKADLAYDLDFKAQKGPGSGEWTCVGLTEKIYESLDISNPNNLQSLEYDPAYYAVNITPDGFDNYSQVNKEGDCFSENVEYSKIGRRTNVILPLPEIVGYNAGREYQGERYFFLPYTQFIQPGLEDQVVDIKLNSNFKEEEVRGKTPVAALILRWSLINNPISSAKIIVAKTVDTAQKVVSSLFNKRQETQVVLNSTANKDASENINEATRIIINKSDSTQMNSETKQEEPTSNSLVQTAQAASDEPAASQPSSLATIKINSQNYQNESAEELGVTTEKAGLLAAVLAAGVKTNTQNVNSQVVTGSQSSTQNKAANKDIVVNSSGSADSSSLSSSLASTVSGPFTGEYLPESWSSSKISAGLKPAGSSAQPTANSGTSTGINPGPAAQSAPPTALISKIYATDNNDFIEIYNPLDYDFDLAEAGLRLEKSKTAEDPSLMMRIGNPADGTYPGGTVIKAKSYYLIVRDDASDFYLSKADAIATRSEFGWTGTGYIIYLGKGAISSSADEDIIDAVGYGAAKYFQGSGPAPAIEDNYFLERISNFGNNKVDFSLAAINDPSVVWEDAGGGAGTDNPPPSNPPATNPPPNNPPPNNPPAGEDENNLGFSAYKFPEPIVSAGLQDLWHFDECYGPYRYSVGRFDCSIEMYTNDFKFSKELSAPLNLNNASISFYYRNSWIPNQSARVNFKLRNSSGQQLFVLLEPNLFQLEGLPHSEWRYSGAPVPNDKEWHNFTLVINGEENYWAAYFDGVEKYRQTFIETLPNNFTEFEFSSDIGSMSIDEVALWTRPLSVNEVLNHWQKAAPFAPISGRSVQRPAELKYFWDFNEGHHLINEGGGLVAKDKIKGLELNLPAPVWIWRGPENTGITHKWDQEVAVDFPAPLSRRDMSIAFWWRSRLYPNEGRTLISLQHEGVNKFALAPEFSARAFYFNGHYGTLGEGKDLHLPNDEAWHHIALTYDSYRYKLRLYIDGAEQYQLPFYWIKDAELPNRLLLKGQLNSVELDDLGVWEGTLSAKEVRDLYEDSRVLP